MSLYEFSRARRARQDSTRRPQRQGTRRNHFSARGRIGLKFAGLDFLTSLALPNFMFHAATAYDILRKRGVTIGKRDFPGQMRTLS